ncbi:MAG TPA: glutathione S-transferase N-terminal domain-containing protein [Bdellovibrio sp.]|uniref:glutathione S-transferase family protein n=1 Tax=Bdellovibrio sp. TaxID=28201 RepID=UPI002EF0FAD0
MIDLYTANTPNGHKIVIMLEELGVPYTKHMIDLKANQQKSPEFLEMNPNGRIPVIIDHEGPFNRKTTVFESGAILYYLAEKYSKFFGQELDQKAHVMQWVMFQMSAIGPNFGNYNYGTTYMPEKVPQFIERFEKESQRLVTVLNSQLTKHQFVAGDSYTIADMTTYTWVSAFATKKPEWFDSAPAIRRWLDAVGNRPAVKKAMS